MCIVEIMSEGFLSFFKIVACNKSAHNQQEEQQEESWRTLNIKQPSASLQVV